MPVSQNRSDGIRVPMTVTASPGRTERTIRPPPPSMSVTAARAMSRTPSDATSFESGDEVRSRRNTTSSTSTPSAIVAPSARTSAGTTASSRSAWKR